MTRKGSPPKLAVELTEEQKRRLDDNLAHGERKPLFRAIVDDLNRIVEAKGRPVIAGVIARQIKLEHFMNMDSHLTPFCPVCGGKLRQKDSRTWECTHEHWRDNE